MFLRGGNIVAFNYLWQGKMKIINQFPQLAVISILTTALTACGGDDDGSGRPGENSSVVVSSETSVSSSEQQSTSHRSTSEQSASQQPTLQSSFSVSSSSQVNSAISSVSSTSSQSSASTPQIMLNELRSDGGGYDFIELYNARNTDYIFGNDEWVVNDIKGFEVDKVPGIAIPGGTMIAAKGHLLIAVDQTSAPF